MPAASHHPLVVVVIAFMTGICFDRFGAPATTPARAVGWWAVAALALIGWWVVRRHGRGELRNPFAAIVLCGGILAAGAAWHHACWNVFEIDDVGRYAAADYEPSCIEAVALENPRRLPAVPANPYRAIPLGERSELALRVVGIRRGRDWQPAGGRARLRVNGQLLGVHAGDRLRVFASVAAPRTPQNPGEFNIAEHARAERRLAEFRCGFPECVEVLERAAWYRPRNLLCGVQQWCLDHLYRELGPEKAPVAAALILGVREGIAREELDAYRETGTVHVLVVSGLHVGILAATACFVCGFVFSSRRASLIVTACLVVAFALVTGGRPSVVRAAVGTLAVLAAVGSGRRVLAFNTLAGAAVAVLVLNPADLFRVGPQLSFLAASTLVWYSRRSAHWQEAEPALDRLERDSRPVALRLGASAGGWIWQVTVAAGCLWLVSLPLIMAQFHLATPVALLLAPVICIIAFVSLVSGFGMLVLEWLLPWAGDVSRLVCSATIYLLRQTVAYAEALPGSHFSVPGPPVWWLLGLYAGLFGSVSIGGRVPARWKLAILSLWVTVGIGSAFLHPGRDELRCTFLSMGHGTCVVLELPDGRTVLYDAGSLTSPDLATSTISTFLWAEGIAQLDGIILSHADVDHFNAVPGLLDHFSVSSVLVSPVMFDPLFQPDEESAPRRLQGELAALGVPVQVVFSGDRLRLGGGVSAEVLHPPRGGLIGSDNANSIVLAVECEGRRILLTGDLESPGMEDVLAELPYDVDLLLAPHHGSRFSDPPGLADWCTPEWVVISGGDEARAEEASRTYRSAGARVLHTSRTGAVRFHVRGGRLIARRWAADAWITMDRSGAALEGPPQAIPVAGIGP